MRVTLSVIEGPHAGKNFSFGDHQTFFVGRSSRCHFQLPKDDQYFSRVHFLIEVNPPRVGLTDMNSRNGTFVNGEKVAQTIELKDGDQITAGRTVIKVAVTDTRPPARSKVEEPAARVTLPEQPAARVPLAEEPEVVSLLPEWFNGPSQLLKAAPGQCPTCRGTLLQGIGPMCADCQSAAAKVDQPIAGYRIVREIGHGSMGIVSLALREADATAYALKTITPTVSGSATTVERFLREAKILSQLQHPHIVGLRDQGEVGGILFFAMDYVPGRDAGQLLKEQGPMDLGRALRLVSPAVEALAYAHGLGFIHRDVKPSNLLVATVNGQEAVRLADFGLAKVYQQSEMSGLTFQGDIGGTVAFMPPEQITDYRNARPPADQYAAAASLYNLLTGRYVYDLPPRDFQKQLLLILTEEPIPITKRRRDVPTGLAKVIHKALSREPEDRYTDMKTFRETLRPFE